MKNYTLLWVGLIISTGLYMLALLFDLDLFERLSSTLEQVETFEFDEVLIPLFVLGFFGLLNLLHLRNNVLKQSAQAQTYVAILTSLDQTFKTFIDDIRRLTKEAEQIPEFDPKTLKDLQASADEVLSQIKELAKIQKVDELSITSQADQAD